MKVIIVMILMLTALDAKSTYTHEQNESVGYSIKLSELPKCPKYKVIANKTSIDGNNNKSTKVKTRFLSCAKNSNEIKIVQEINRVVKVEK